LVKRGERHHQTSVTAGTVFHGVRAALWKWRWAAYQLAQDKKGIAALELAKQVGVCYQTAWTMLHKLRWAMRCRNQRYVLQGLVEVDDAYVGGTAEGTGTTGRGAAHKTPIAVAVELGSAGQAAARGVGHPGAGRRPQSAEVRAPLDCQGGDVEDGRLGGVSAGGPRRLRA
jgi:hypothetical protein